MARKIEAFGHPGSLARRVFLSVRLVAAVLTASALQLLAHSYAGMQALPSLAGIGRGRLALGRLPA